MTMFRHLLFLFVLASAAWGQSPFANPFRSQATLLGSEGQEVLQVEFSFPPGHYLYGNMVKVEASEPAGVRLIPLDHPPARRKYDTILEEEVEVYEASVALLYRVENRQGTPLKITVGYQGCTSEICFMPQKNTFVLAEVGVAPPALVEKLQAGGGNTQLDALLERFTVGGRETGYLAPGKFLDFLNQAEAGTALREEDRLIQRVFRRYGLLAVLVLLLPLGFLLNLTPCVLPMIPINMAIIGAGAQAGSRKRGFALGTVYGAGMALVYGVLGLVVVLTGSQFGALNSSPWFNLAIAVVFIALALAMFDVFVIDLSRFQRRGPGGEDSPKAPFLTSFILGGTAALLAGACVAPVLISVLVLATNLYQTNPAALLLPFMLGVGMALPWPFAGAGLSFLPKPGVWMNRVKYLFGVLILLAAFYYGRLAIGLLLPTPAEDGRHRTEVAAALEQALAEGKPVFLDFWSLSCKACKQMETKVFPRPEVAARLGDFVFAGVQTDLEDREDVAWAVETFAIKGLPTYIVLVPKPAGE